MAQAIFEVQTFDGHGWVTRHRGVDVDAAGEAARHVLPSAKKHAVRIVKQSYDPARQQLDTQVVFSLGQARSRTRRRMFGFAAGLAMTAAAAGAALLLPPLEPMSLLAPVTDAAAVAETPVVAEAAPVQAGLATLRPAAGSAQFNCEREAAAGLIRATNISVDRDQLYVLCADAVQGDPAAQVALASRLAAGAGTEADPAQAVEWLQEAARAGHVAAYRPLADLLIDAGSDPARAIAWYHRAATGGDVETARMLAERYRTGDGVAADARIALSYELMAAEAGDVDAMLEASAAFRDGNGAAADPDAARRWHERAVAAGASEAAPAVETAAAAQAIQWSSPQPAADSGLIQVPPLHLDIDGDANETFSSFAAGPALASV